MISIYIIKAASPMRIPQGDVCPIADDWSLVRVSENPRPLDEALFHLTSGFLDTLSQEGIIPRVMESFFMILHPKGGCSKLFLGCNNIGKIVC